MLQFFRFIGIDSFERIQAPINPYGKAKKITEDIILDFSKSSDIEVKILRLVVFRFVLKNIFFIFQFCIIEKC